MSNLETSLVLKASVEQFAAGINQAATQFAGAMDRVDRTAEQTGSSVETSLKKVGIRRHAEIEAEIKAVEDAYRQLAESGELSSRELAQASLEMQERVRELRAETNGRAESLGKMKGELTAASVAVYGIQRMLSSAATASMDFGRSMAEVSTLLDDTSGLDAMPDAVRRLTIEYGGDVQKNAKALYDIIPASASDATTSLEHLDAASVPRSRGDEPPSVCGRKPCACRTTI